MVHGKNLETLEEMCNDYSIYVDAENAAQCHADTLKRVERWLNSEAGRKQRERCSIVNFDGIILNW